MTKAGKILIKNKTGEDRAVLKKKLQDLEKEWEKVCQVSVERQEKLENAYKKIGQFRYIVYHFSIGLVVVVIVKGYILNSNSRHIFNPIIHTH